MTRYYVDVPYGPPDVELATRETHRLMNVYGISNGDELYRTLLRMIRMEPPRDADQPNAAHGDFITRWVNEPRFPERVELLKAEMKRLTDQQPSPQPSEDRCEKCGSVMERVPIRTGYHLICDTCRAARTVRAADPTAAP